MMRDSPEAKHANSPTHLYRTEPNAPTPVAALRVGMGGALESWEDARVRPRFGFGQGGGIVLRAASTEDEGFAESASWMRERLNRLISTLNPRIQRMIAAGA